MIARASGLLLTAATALVACGDDASGPGPGGGVSVEGGAGASGNAPAPGGSSGSGPVSSGLPREKRFSNFIEEGACTACLEASCGAQEGACGDMTDEDAPCYNARACVIYRAQSETVTCAFNLCRPRNPRAYALNGPVIEEMYACFEAACADACGIEKGFPCPTAPPVPQTTAEQLGTLLGAGCTQCLRASCAVEDEACGSIPKGGPCLDANLCVLQESGLGSTPLDCAVASCVGAAATTPNGGIVNDFYTCMGNQCADACGVKPTFPCATNPGSGGKTIASLFAPLGKNGACTNCLEASCGSQNEACGDMDGSGVCREAGECIVDGDTGPGAKRNCVVEGCAVQALATPSAGTVNELLTCMGSKCASACGVTKEFPCGP